ncbi:protein THEMIS [Pelodytes ibericus]
MATTLQKFIESLDPRTLPRVLEIQSGYYGGPLYDLSDGECSLSTGEVMKIIAYKVKKLLVHIHTNNEYDQLQPPVELPLNFPGLFKIVPDKNPYFSIEEIVKALYVGQTQFGDLAFYSNTDLHIGKITICKNKEILMKSIEDVNGVMSVNCVAVLWEKPNSFVLPLSYTGEFYEYEDENIYTLKEILDCKIPKNRNRSVILSDLRETWDITNLYSNDFNGIIILKPVYEVQAVMEFGKDIINLLSDLDVEVLDVTEGYNMKYFIQTLTTHDIFERTTKEFPMMAEIMDGVSTNHTVYNLLKHGEKIIIHAKHQADRVIASELKSDSAKKHFLIPSSYKGKFKRRPRFFPTAYDLKIANLEMDDLHVVATKSFQSPHKEFSSVNVGDQFQVMHPQSCEIIRNGNITIVDALVCTKMENNCCVRATLPLYMEGGFMEVVHDKRQYYISELCKKFRLPVNVKVSVRDLFTMGEDILAKTSSLELEEQITDSYLLVSLIDSPKEVWELPVNRINISFHVTSSFYGDTYFSPTRTNTEEITEEEYYMVRRYENHVQYPPPRPPKTPLHTCIIDDPATSCSEKTQTPETVPE